MGCLQGYRIEITGKCRLSRVDAQRLLEKHGARVDGAVGASTHVLLTGKALSKPKKKDLDAQTFGIPTTDADQFLDDLQRGQVPAYMSQGAASASTPKPSAQQSPPKAIQNPPPATVSKNQEAATAQRKSLVEAGRKLMGDFAV